MTEESKRNTRIVLAPGNASPMSGGEVLSVELAPGEDVEWVWSHDRERGSAVTGYRIVPPNSALLTEGVFVGAAQSPGGERNG